MEEDGSLRVQYNISGGWQYPATLLSSVQTDRWYVLNLRLSDTAGFTVTVVQEDAPSVGGSYTYSMPAGKAWRFRHWNYRGTAYLDSCVEYGAAEWGSFSYDALDRLVSAQATGGPAPAYTQSYSYNAIGNMLSKSDVGLYTYPASGEDSVRPHAVTETTAGWAFDYDDNGNMVTRTVTEGTYLLSYTWENQLAAITDTTSMAVTRYVYDADGVLVKKVGPEGTTHYVGGYYEKNVTTDVATSYYTFGGQRVAMRTGSTLSYLYADDPSLALGTGLGSASLTMDESWDRASAPGSEVIGRTRDAQCQTFLRSGTRDGQHPCVNSHPSVAIHG